MSPKVSIIIPVYNVEKYIRRCVESVLNQSLRNIEVILVDDGSTDNSGLICDEYAAVDNRIKVIHSLNRGVSSARNKGLELAKGEYVGFVDSDDIVSSRMYEVLLKCILVAESDMAMCHYSLINGDERASVVNPELPPYKYKVLNRKEAFELVADFRRPILVSVWNKLIRKNVIQNIRFDETKRMAEDCEFFFSSLINCSRIVYCPYELYGYYDQREGAATFKQSKGIDWYIESDRNISYTMDMVAKTCPELSNLAVGFRSVMGIMSIANAMVREGRMNHEICCSLKNTIRSDFIPIMCSQLRTYKKIQILLFFLNYKIYYQFMKRKMTG